MPGSNGAPCVAHIPYSRSMSITIMETRSLFVEGFTRTESAASEARDRAGPSEPRRQPERRAAPSPGVVPSSSDEAVEAGKEEDKGDEAPVMGRHSSGDGESEQRSVEDEINDLSKRGDTAWQLSLDEIGSKPLQQ